MSIGAEGTKQVIRGSSFLHGSLEERCAWLERTVRAIGRVPDLGPPLLGQPAAELRFVADALRWAEEEGIHGVRRLQLLALLAVPTLIRDCARIDWSRYPWPAMPFQVLQGHEGARELIEVALGYEDAAFTEQFYQTIRRKLRDEAIFADGILWRSPEVAFPLAWDERIRIGRAPLTPFTHRVHLGPWLPPPEKGNQARGVLRQWIFQVAPPRPREQESDAPLTGYERRGNQGDPLLLSLGDGLEGSLTLTIDRQPLGARGSLRETPFPVRLSVYAARALRSPAALIERAGYEPESFGRPVHMQPRSEVPVQALVGPAGGPALGHGWSTVPLDGEPLETAVLLGVHWLRAAFDPVGLPSLERAPEWAEDLPLGRAMSRSEQALYLELLRALCLEGLRELAKRDQTAEDAALLWELEHKVSKLPASELTRLAERLVRRFQGPSRPGALRAWLAEALRKREGLADAIREARQLHV